MIPEAVELWPPGLQRLPEARFYVTTKQRTLSIPFPERYACVTTEVKTSGMGRWYEPLACRSGSVSAVFQQKPGFSSSPSFFNQKASVDEQGNQLPYNFYGSSLVAKWVVALLKRDLKELGICKTSGVWHCFSIVEVMTPQPIVSERRGFRGPGHLVSGADWIPGTVSTPVSLSHQSDEA